MWQRNEGKWQCIKHQIRGFRFEIPTDSSTALAASWAGALATLGSPVAAMELYMDAAGIIWRAVGDESEDLTW